MGLGEEVSDHCSGGMFDTKLLIVTFVGTITALTPAAVIRLSSRDEQRRKPRKRHSWAVDEARRFLESARRDDDVLYAACVLVPVLGLRRGEVLGLTWDRIDLDLGELYVDEQPLISSSAVGLRPAHPTPCLIL
jgi:integrase